jgi:hypothetical protein
LADGRGLPAAGAGHSGPDGAHSGLRGAACLPSSLLGANLLDGPRGVPGRRSEKDSDMGGVRDVDCRGQRLCPNPAHPDEPVMKVK